MDIFYSLIIVFVILGITIVFKKKIKNLNPKTNLLSLIVFVLIAMLAHNRISNPDIKVLYSLCLIIASGIGRYGTIMRSKLEKDTEDLEYSGYRQIIYAVLFIFGLLGLIA